MRRKKFVSNFAKYRSLFRKNFVHSFFFRPFKLISFRVSRLRLFFSPNFFDWDGLNRRLLYFSSAEEGSFEIQRKDKAARRRKKQKKKKIGITGKFFIIETSLSLAAYSFSTVFAYLLSSFLAQQMVCVCVSSPAISSLPTCSIEVFHKNWWFSGSVLSVNAPLYFVLLFFYSLSVHIGGLLDCH